VSTVVAGRALVTGAAGFVGRYLLEALLADGWSVTATALGAESGAGAAARTAGDVRWVFGDLRDEAHVAEAVRVGAPDLVVHLAAISHLPTAASDPAAAWDINVTAGVRLLHALAAAHQAGVLAPRVLIIGSAEQYGRHDDGLAPLTESAAQWPRTVYAATKAAQEVAALQVWRSTGLPVVVARPFNHSGAGQDPRFLLPALVGRAVTLRREAAGAPLVLGNTSPIRDFLHVSDVVAAYIALGRHGVAGEAYNVASGVGRSVREVAERILARVGLDATLHEDPALVRPVDVPSLVGDPARIQSATDWRPLRTFDDILDDLLHAEAH
jgi:GDP-4-dehydro-6-deoxy-D-mannose reductase